MFNAVTLRRVSLGSCWSLDSDILVCCLSFVSITLISSCVFNVVTLRFPYRTPLDLFGIILELCWCQCCARLVYANLGKSRLPEATAQDFPGIERETAHREKSEKENLASKLQNHLQLEKRWKHVGELSHRVTTYQLSL